MADYSLRYAACHAEDNAGSGVRSKGSVRLGVGQVFEVNTGLGYHTSQLLRGEDKIDEPFAVLFKLGALCLRFLGGAGHYCHGEDALSSEVSADKRAEHLHGRAAGRYLRHELGMLILNMLYPARTARGEHRQLCARLKLVQEFSSFLHDGKVGGERGIEYIVRSETLQCRNYLAHDRLGCGNSELLAQTDPDGGCDLNRDLLGLIEQSLAHFGDIAFHGERARRAHGGALSAAYALRIGELIAEAAGYIRIAAALGKIDDVDILYLGAHAHAFAAEDALGRIAHDAGGGIVNRFRAVMQREVHGVDSVAARVFLQAALAGLVAGGAFRSVARQQHFEYHSAVLGKGFGEGFYCETVPWYHGAGGVDLSALVLDDAHTASAVDREIFAIAEIGYVNSVFSCDLEHIALFFKFAAYTVNYHTFHRLNLLDGAYRTQLHAQTAVQALLRVNDMRNANGAGYSIARAVHLALAAANADVRIDPVAGEAGALSRRADFVHNVGYIFVAEILQRA